MRSPGSRRLRRLLQWMTPIGLVPLFACLAPPVESPLTTITQETSGRVEQNVKNKVDLLFMIDNSPSMQPKQEELRRRVPQLIKALEGFATMGSPASYHIGVVTSDLGAGPEHLGNGQCHPGGDGARLQVAPSPHAMNPPSVCASFTLGGGVRYLDYNQLDGTNNIVGGLDVPTAFSCMSAVGDGGCGFEHQLEAAYRALHDPIPENQGFLRKDAILAVVFVSDEDDCSAAPTTDLFAQTDAAMQSYGLLHSFRCTQFGILCNGQPVLPMSTPTPLTGCVSAPNPNDMGPGKLIDVDKYINYFTGPSATGGVKTSRDDVILVSITAPKDPVAVAIDTPCDTPTATSCAELQHSCNASSTVFGDPAVRIESVVRHAAHASVTSICDSDYTAAMDGLEQLIIKTIGPGCINAPVATRAPVHGPDCVVEDVTTNPDRSTTTREIPSCVENGHVTPCWQLVDRLAEYQSGGCVPAKPVPPTCKLPLECQPVVNPIDGSMQLASISIDRGGAMPPDDTTARVSCATIASSGK